MRPHTPPPSHPATTPRPAQHLSPHHPYSLSSRCPAPGPGTSPPPVVGGGGGGGYLLKKRKYFYSISRTTSLSPPFHRQQPTPHSPRSLCCLHLTLPSAHTKLPYSTPRISISPHSSKPGLSFNTTHLTPPSSVFTQCRFIDTHRYINSFYTTFLTATKKSHQRTFTRTDQIYHLMT